MIISFNGFKREKALQQGGKKMIGSKKFMLTVFWNTEGFIIIDLLPEGLKFNSECFINNILEKIYQITSDLRLKSCRKITLHFDNARVNTARKVIQFMDLYQMKRTPHLPFSPYIAASDFYLFGFLKDRLAGQVLSRQMNFLRASLKF